MGNALLRAHDRTPPGVERGVTGAEKLFQQNRAFGPGPIKPYPDASPTRRFLARALPNYRPGSSAPEELSTAEGRRPRPRAT